MDFRNFKNYENLYRILELLMKKNVMLTEGKFSTQDQFTQGVFQL